MTPIDYAAFAERLEALAERLEALAEPYDDEQRQWADDLRTVAAMLEGMADQEPVGWIIKHELSALREDGQRAVILHTEPVANGIEVPLYPHPAPQTDRCKHGVRFPHECKECAVERAAYEAAAKVCESLENRVISTHPARIEFDPNSFMARKCAGAIRSLMQEQPK